MERAITDYVEFLADTRDTVYRLDYNQNTAGQLANEEEMKERELETARKAVSNSVNQTTKKCLDETNSSCGQEFGKGQERLKKTGVKREEAKSRGVREQITEETNELQEHNKGLKVQMGTLFQKNQVPTWCGTTFYYALYYPRGFREIMIFLLTLVICFLGIPCGVYLLIPQRVIWYLAIMYFVGVLLFGGFYVVIGNKTRLRHQDTLKRGRDVYNHPKANQKKIKIITRTIQKDGSEDLCDPEKYDDEIACVEQELSEIASREKSALGTFENVIKTIISDEIIASHKDKLDRLRQEPGEVSTSLRNLESSIREQNIRIVDTYSPYLGKESLQPEKLIQLSRIIQAGLTFNITEAVKVHQDVEQDTGWPQHSKYNSYIRRSCRL